MRRDYLKTHMKQHEDGKFESESFCALSLRTSKTSLDNESIISSISTSYEVSSTKEEELRKILKRDDEEYKYKLAQGKILFQSMYDMGIAEESLRPEFKEMLDLYRKQREYMNINQVILRPWQQSLLEHMKPRDREIIWVIGKKYRNAEYRTAAFSKLGGPNFLLGQLSQYKIKYSNSKL